MGPSQRPLSELSPVAQKRNSPSWKDPASNESSPFENSPLNNATSPRRFWQGRDPGSPYRLGHENSDPYEGSSMTSSPSKRSSIENLMRASRVKNSNMFAREHKQEYDPTHIQVLERPLASGRPLSRQFQNSQDGTSQIDARRQLPSQTAGFRNSGEGTGTPPATSKSGDDSSSPIKSPTSQSPGKSSLSKGSRFGRTSASFDPRREIWSDDGDESKVSMASEGYSYHRQTKSVTFDAAPPQVNEYEMTTPVPSSVASSSREGSYEDASNEDSFDHSYSMEIEDSFDASLEDTDKTPVVLPDEWRYMSPDSGNEDAAGNDDDPFSDDFGSPGPDIRPSSRDSTLFKNRIESLDSNGERRPLPPLPPSQSTPQASRSSPSPGLSAAFERGSSAQRDMPQPLRPASCSKADISSPSRNSLSLEDRLKLMMTGEHSYQSDAESQRERRMRRAGAKERSVERDLENSHQSEGNNESTTIESPRISRESILKNLKSQQESAEPNDYHDSSHNSGTYSSLPFDPDVPIPSLETDQPMEDETVIIKEEEEEVDVDLYSVPSFGENDNNDEFGHTEGQNHIVDDSSSRYSDTSKDDIPTPPEGALRSFEMSSGELTPTKGLHSSRYPEHDLLASTMSSTDGDHPFDVQFTSYIDQSTPPAEERLVQPPRLDLESIRNSLDRPGTPDSVIRHPVSPEESPDRSLIVPEPIATIKAPGGTYKTRTSLTPADVSTMAATRRRVSGQDVPVSPIEEFKPSLPRIEKSSQEENVETDTTEEPRVAQLAPLPEKSRISSLVKLDIPMDSGSDGFGLDAEFDRVMEAQKVAFDIPFSQLSAQASSNAGNQAQDNSHSSLNKHTADTTTTKQRGYLMRQNTKMVVATSRPEDDENTESSTAPNSPRKASQQTWTTEPWTPKARRQSIKLAGAVPRKKVAEESVPPLPGQESSVKDTSNGAEEATEAETGEPADNTVEEGDRGRLFVKVVGAKDLDLPLPRGERSYFSLTLDNGLHCVTTSCLELGRSAPIGQEFELVVMQELEFQLTLQMKPDQIKPKPQPVRPASPAKTTKPQKPSAFSRVFASPKKRRELELRQQQEAQQLQKRQAEEKALANIIDPWEKVRKIVDKDGNFARAYVSLADFEERAFGRPLNVDVTCFNEWAIDETVSSVKSKRSTATTVSRRPPYKIGTLELQLLYVPKPKGATDDDMPKSMNACIREMREADHAASRSWEGFLSQQGGDCPYWRRRLFKLQGSKLTAFHEVTRQPRATINLAKAVKLIDDKSSLTQKETSAKGGRRRKSAFAEEEEGYMFVEEGFRIRFGNGEVIDFYADSRVEKEGWMKVLSETVGKGYSSGSGQVKPWTDLILRREKQLNIKRPAAEEKRPLVEEKKPVRHSYAPPPPPKEQHIGQARPTPAAIPRPRHQHQLSQPNISSQEARRQKTRSLIF